MIRVHDEKGFEAGLESSPDSNSFLGNKGKMSFFSQRLGGVQFFSEKT